MKRLFKRIYSEIIRYPDAVIIAILVSIKLAVVFVNIGGYPYIENDEATYSLRALSFANSGELDYYTYWYDHAPGGWIIMSPIVFINSIIGHPVDIVLLLRMMMVGLAAGGVALTYLIGQKLFNRRLPSLIAVLLITFSPLANYYQRRVLLDNIMVFMVLVSVYLILRNPKRLPSYATSGAVFGIAVLSKINAIFVLPAMWLLIWQKQTHKLIRRHSITLWTFMAGSVTSLWLLFAGLKGELLPYNSNPESGAFEKITLIDTLKFQSARGGDPKWPWDPTSNIYPNAADWFIRDKLLISILGACFVIATIMLLRKKFRDQLLFLWLTIILLVIFIVRGGVVLGFYFLPLLPFAALIAGFVITWLLGFIKYKRIRQFAIVIIASLVIFFSANPIVQQWSKDETSNQMLAIEWIEKNIKDKDTLIISDNYALPYLIDKGYKNVDYQFKVEYDPDINERKYSKDWRKGAYIIVSHEVLRQIKEGTTPFVKEAFDHSVKVASFTRKSSSYIDTEKYISTNGDWAQIYQIKSDAGVYLQDSWMSYKQNYIKSYGQVISDIKSKKWTTTSSNQAITMQMAAAEDDQAAFDGVWQWTKDHFQNRVQDKLLSSEWGVDDKNKEILTDTNTTSYANVQAALGLIEAYEKWGDKKYLSQAKILISDIQIHETRTLNNRIVLLPFTTQLNAPSYAVNPSYGDPYAYKQFAKYYPKNAKFWNQAIKDYYKFITELQASSKENLVPDWVTINSAGRVIQSPPNTGAESFGYEAYRIPQILSRAYQNSNDEQAFTILTKFSEFYQKQLQLSKGNSDTVYAVYSINGKPLVDFEDVSTNVSMLSAFHVSGDDSLNRLEASKIVGQYNKIGYWGEANNVRNQQAVWRYYDQFYTRLD